MVGKAYDERMHMHPAFVIILLIPLLLPSPAAHAQRDPSTSHARTAGNGPINLSGNNIPIPAAFEQIKAQTGYDIFFDPGLPGLPRTITLHLKNASLSAALKACLENTGLVYLVSKRSVFIKQSSDLEEPGPISAHVSEIKKIDELDSTQVIGYGTITRRINTGDITSIPAKELVLPPVSNVLAALEGRVAGLVITESNGGIGAGFRVMIRGQNSLAEGANPLVIIDGIPFFSDYTLSHIPSGMAAGSLSPFVLLDPNTIERIEVLKDADATAIYGSRGANGVILITTKKGKVGNPQLSAHVFSGFSRVTVPMPLMNTPQYMQMRREAFNNDGLQPDINTAPELLLWDTTRNTDLGKLLTGGVAHCSEAALSFPGSQGLLRYLLAGSWRSETSVFPGNPGDHRVSLMGNLSRPFLKKDRLHVQLSGMWVYDTNNQPVTDPTGYRSLAPDAPPLIDVGGHLVWQEKGISFTNPLSFLWAGYGAHTSNVLYNGQLSYQLFRLFILKVSGGYNGVLTKENSSNPIAAQDPGTAPTATAYTGSTAYTNWIFEPQGDLSDTLGNSIFHLTAGATWQAQHTAISGMTASGIPSDLLLGDLNAATLVNVTVNTDEYRYQGWFGRLNYQYKASFLLNLSVRRDGSSRFGPGKRFGNFGAGGAGWIFSNQPFVKEGLSWMSFGKLRVSYGITGNDEIGNYQYLGTWNTTNNQPYQGMTGFYPTSLYNPDLAWEEIRKLEAALELGFLRDRILLNIAWYRNRSVNQIIPNVLPFQAGFASVLANFPAVIQNSGIEISGQSRNILSRKLSWTSSINLSLPANKLVAFKNLAGSAYAGTLVVGKSIHVVKAYPCTGVDPETGVFGFGKSLPLSSRDQVVVGQQDLRVYGGLNNSVRYGPWELDIFLEGRVQTGSNAVVAQYTMNIPGMAGPNQFGNEPVQLLNRWQKRGDFAAYEKFTTLASSAAAQAIPYLTGSGATLANASFLRLKAFSLSWHLPKNILERAHLDRAAFFCRAQNLLTHTRYRGADPETQNPFNLPPLKTIVAGIELTLK